MTEPTEPKNERPPAEPEWPKNDPVPEGGVPLPPEHQTPPLEDEE